MRASRSVALALLLASCAPAVGRVTTAPAPPPTFQPVTLAPTLAPTLEPTVSPTRAPVAVPTPRLVVILNRSIVGKASWYCNLDDVRYPRSVCHYRYPDRKGPDLYAAACGKLRRAMGIDWRGRFVTVVGNDRQVVVQLVDWCGSDDKTIDLYRDAADVLGFGGVLEVTVRW